MQKADKGDLRRLARPALKKTFKNPTFQLSNKYTGKHTRHKHQNQYKYTSKHTMKRSMHQCKQVSDLLTCRVRYNPYVVAQRWGLRLFQIQIHKQRCVQIHIQKLYQNKNMWKSVYICMKILVKSLHSTHANASKSLIFHLARDNPSVVTQRWALRLF